MRLGALNLFNLLDLPRFSLGLCSKVGKGKSSRERDEANEAAGMREKGRSGGPAAWGAPAASRLRVELLPVNALPRRVRVERCEARGAGLRGNRREAWCRAMDKSGRGNSKPVLDRVVGGRSPSSSKSAIACRFLQGDWDVMRGRRLSRIGQAGVQATGT